MYISNLFLIAIQSVVVFSNAVAEPVSAPKELAKLDLSAHPLGHFRDLSKTSFAPNTMRNRDQNGGELEGSAETSGDRAACWFGSQYGCTDSYCWKTCNNPGEWCWTNRDGGWARCSNWNDCNTGLPCGGACSC